MKKILIPGLIAGIAMLVAGMAASILYGMLVPTLMAEYSNTNMFRPWSDPLMQAFFAYPLVVGLALAWVWDKAKGLITGSLVQRALKLTIAYLIVATIPGMFVTYTSFQVSLAMIVGWTISGFVYAFTAGLVLGKMNG